MPTPVSYEVFLANVNADDLAMLTTFIVGVSAVAGDAAEADALFVQAERLYNAGMLTELRREFRDINDAVQQSFSGVVTPVGAGYVARLARERIVLSREPLP